MAFTLDDIVIDRTQMATAEKTDGTLLYTLTQLSEATIETTAESKEARSAEGSLIKKFYQGKAGTFTATNAMINLNVIGAASGTDKEIGAPDAMIQMPKIVIVKKGTATIDLVDGANETLVAGTVHVNALGNNDTQNAKITVIADDYLRNGGYPETINMRSITRSYLSTLFDSIIWKDVAKRHNIRNITDLNNLALYLLSNFCNPLSANDISTELSMSSVTTTRKFMDYLHEPYLFYYLPRFNNKLKLMKKAATKVYVIDNGFVTSKAFNISENLGRLLENEVFVELLRQGFQVETSLFYYRSRNDREVDFVTRKGAHIHQLIQVCYDMTSPKTEKREVASLIECAEELKCNNLIIITNNDEREIIKDGYSIKVVPFTKFASAF